MKNFFSFKTGHKASDEYFKNQPIWFDSDMIHSCILGFCIGVVSTLLIIVVWI